MATWLHVSHCQPCPICDKPDWCARSSDGVWALCRRVDTGAGVHKVDKAGADYWLYHHAPYRHSILEVPSQPHAERAEPVILDLAYRALLAVLPLSLPHRQALRQRGLSDKEIVRRGYRTLPLHGRATLARQMVKRFGIDVCAQVPGLYVATQNTRRWWTLAGALGLLIPVRNVDGRIVALKVRADSPGEGSKYTYLSSAHHRGPGPGAPVHVPLHALVPGVPVRFTEGELKADVATALSGVLTIAVPGVSAWRKVLPLLPYLQARQVLLAFDADWRTNPHVAQALGHAASALVTAGYEVQVEDWDPALAKGVDDLLATGHRPALQSVAIALGASLRCHARVWTGTLATRAAEEVAPWH
jgi:hypothetical protein